MKIFITGSTGYIGHNLALTLANQGHSVHALVRDLKSDSLPLHDNIKLFKGDINDKDSIKTAINGCEQAYHVAAFARLGGTYNEAFFRVNVQGTENVLAQAMEAGIKKFVFTSSVAVLGPSMNFPLTENDPRIKTFNNDYELTKSIAEKLVISYNQKGLPGVIVSLSRVYGPGVGSKTSGVNKFISMTLKGNRLVLPSGQNAEANYVFIDDVINGHLLAMSHGLPGEKYIIGGEDASFEKLFSTIIPLTGKKIKFFKIPYNLIRAGCYIPYLQARIALREPTLSPGILDQLFTNRKVSSQKAIEKLGYSYTPLQAGIQKTIQFLTSAKNGSN